MDDRKIKTFLTTARLGSITKAASELNCSQSALTQTIKSIETELDCQVFLRSHNGVSLTPAGEELYSYFQSADSVMDQLIGQAKKLSAGQLIPIRLGSFASISNSWLPEFLKEYRELHPEIRFSLHIATDGLADLMGEGAIDIALGDYQRLSAFKWYSLIEDPYFAVLPESFVSPGQEFITQEELISHPFIMAPMNALDHYLYKIPEDRIEITCDDDSTLVSMVSKGLGCTAMPHLCLMHMPENVRILPMVPYTIREIGIALPPVPSPAVKEFTRFLRSKRAFLEKFYSGEPGSGKIP